MPISVISFRRWCYNEAHELTATPPRLSWHSVSTTTRSAAEDRFSTPVTSLPPPLHRRTNHLVSCNTQQNSWRFAHVCRRRICTLGRYIRDHRSVVSVLIYAPFQPRTCTKRDCVSFRARPRHRGSRCSFSSAPNARLEPDVRRSSARGLVLRPVRWCCLGDVGALRSKATKEPGVRPDRWSSRQSCR